MKSKYGGESAGWVCGWSGWVPAVVMVFILSGCSSSSETQSGTPVISVDGSSTVYPITKKAAERFRKKFKEGPIAINFSGTGGGFKKFCANQTDINDASRPINEKERAACREAGVAFMELPVAFDALTVVVHVKNDWANDITLAELKKIWQPGSEGAVTRWNQVRPSWPDRPLKLFGPGRDSGTFDYFTEVVVGEAGASRNDYFASEDDNVLVDGVSQDANALGYFGLGYYANNWEVLKSLAVDSGRGPVQPTVDAVKKATYKPLARPLFIYVNTASMEKKPVLKKFVEFYLKDVPRWVPFVGYIPLSSEVYDMVAERFQGKEQGTVYADAVNSGQPLIEMLRKTPRS